MPCLRRSVVCRLVQAHRRSALPGGENLPISRNTRVDKSVRTTPGSATERPDPFSPAFSKRKPLAEAAYPDAALRVNPQPDFSDHFCHMDTTTLTKQIRAMAKKCFLSFLFLLFATPVFAQNNEFYVTATIARQNTSFILESLAEEIRVEPFGAGFQYERPIATNSALVVDASFTYYRTDQDRSKWMSFTGVSGGLRTYQNINNNIRIFQTASAGGSYLRHKLQENITKKEDRDVELLLYTDIGIGYTLGNVTEIKNAIYIKAYVDIDNTTPKVQNFNYVGWQLSVKL